MVSQKQKKMRVYRAKFTRYCLDLIKVTTDTKQQS
jgi:hypothetical protein